MKIEPGDRFGSWTTIEKLIKNNHYYWKCQCDCGTVKDVRTDNLSSGRSTSCGCQANKKRSQALIKDITGQRFGHLVAIEPTGRKNKCGQQYWLFQCDCGNLHEALGVTARAGKVLSCGCLVSKGEEKIISELLKLEVPFRSQVIFKDCLTENNNPMRFDFGIYDKEDRLLFLLEYQGETHFKYRESPSSWMTKERLETYQERDRIKKKYCEDHNIILKEITYKEFQEIPRLLRKFIEETQEMQEVQELAEGGNAND